MPTLLVLVVIICSYTDVKAPSKNPCSRRPPGFVEDSPGPCTAGGGGGGVTVRFSRFVGLRGASRGIMISPPRLRRPSVGTDNEEMLIGLVSSLGPGAACAVSFSSTVISGGRNGPLNGCTFSFSAKRTVSALRISKGMLTTTSLRPIGNVVIKLRTSLDSDTFIGGPFSHMSHASDQKHFAVHNVTPNGCRVFNLVSNGRGCLCSSGARVVTFYSSVVVPSVRTTIHRSAL